MKKNNYDEIILDESDLCDLIMQGRDITQINRVTVDTSIDVDTLLANVSDANGLLTWNAAESSSMSVQEYDLRKQSDWAMPQHYRDLDIAEYILSCCTNDDQLQRAGQELLMYQERGLFDLLRYMKYLVDTMKQQQIIWGVGRGSSVSSYVLYLLGVHRIDSLFYDLDPGEFLR